MFENKKILITGGTGSLGSALTKKLLNENVNTIRIFSRDELKQTQMDEHNNLSPSSWVWDPWTAITEPFSHIFQWNSFIHYFGVSQFHSPGAKLTNFWNHDFKTLQQIAKDYYIWEFCL